MKKITIALIMVISLIAPIQTMAESVNQNGTIIEPLEQNIEQIIGVINIDTIAEKSDLGYMAMIEGNKRPDNAEYDDEGLKKLAELNKNSMSELFTPSDRFFLTMATNSDHYPFALVNIPAVSIVQDWQDGLNVNDSSDVKENMDIQRIVEVIDQVMEVLPTIN